MSYRGHAPSTVSTSEANGSLGFLKSVVSDSSGLQRNDTDSDKENDHRLMTISEESTETKSGAENQREQTQSTFTHHKVDRPGLNDAHDSAMAGNGGNDIWDDFYTDEDFKVKENEEVNSSQETNGFLARFEAENRVLDKVEEECEGTDERSQGDDYSSIFESSVRDDEVDRDSPAAKADSSGGPNEKKKRKTKKLFKRRLPPTIVTTSQTTGGSHPDLGRPDKNSHTSSNQLETMSESGGSGVRGRRLSRRKQVSRPRCAGPSPSGDVLQQKYQELEQLVLKPLPNPAAYVKQTRQQMLRLQGMGSQYHASNHTGPSSQVVEGLPPPSGSNAKVEGKRHNQVIVEEISDEGYSTIRTIQVVQGSENSSTSTRHNRPKTAHPSRRPRSGNRQVRPASAGRARPSSAVNHRPQENRDAADTNPQRSRGSGPQRNRKNRSHEGRDQSGGGRGGQRSDSESKDRSSRDSRDSRDVSSDNPSRSNSRSPNRNIQHTDSHMKYSSNPALQQWLKMKNKQHRLQKREERKKKRAEREEKQEIERQRQESFKDSDKKVKEWMVRKRKEAWKKAKEDKKREKEEEKERLERQEQSQCSGSLMGQSIIRRPQSAPAHSDRKMFIPIIRPDGDQATNNNSKEQINGEAPVPQPPKSKFVYKRPVSGRVRLMKLQQERKEDSRKQEIKKKEMEKLTEEEKNRKMRMSYDQWLIRKRQEDYEKRQKAAKQRALAKSDPELERIAPEMARRRIENIQRGKRRIQTNVDSIDEDINKSFGGGDFGEGETGQIQAVPGLQVSGRKKSLGQRPSSAKAASSGSPLNPQMSKSPRRPKSAHPQVQRIMDSGDEERVVDAKAFQLPFPPELGVPKYVAERQEKLFSPGAISKASTDFESQKSLVDAQESKSEDEEKNGNSCQVNEKAGRIKPDTSTDHEDAIDRVSEKEGDEDSSFFLTDSKIVIEEKEEIVLGEVVEQEAFDKSEYDEEDYDEYQDVQEKSESNEGIGQSEEDDISAVPGTEMKSDEDEQENEEQKMNEEQEGKENETDTTTDDISQLMKLEEPVNDYLEEDTDVLVEEKEFVEEEGGLVEEEGGELDPLTKLKLPPEEEEQTLEMSVDKDSEPTEKNDNMEQSGGEETKSEVSESKSSTKHVSFVEQAVIHEDPLAGIPAEDYEDTDDDEAEDERGDFLGEDSPRNNDNFWEGNRARDQIDQGDDDDYF